ncbi:sialin-like [Gigantopelta aegis]|uniref:sialin-like n=1 Tax=Gigantopelta aegis TaxID=1735272 RepID=UPI001B88E008|nr:sialin-like [Gigantopelta aegis]
MKSRQCNPTSLSRIPQVIVIEDGVTNEKCVQTLSKDVVKVGNGCACENSNESTSTSSISARAVPEQMSPTTSETKKMTTTWRERLLCWRWRTSFIVCFGFINTLIMRNAFNIALVCMTGADPRTDTSLNISGNVTEHHGEFDWDANTQGIILSAVMYLAFAAPAVSGFLARRFGAKRVIAIGMGISTVCHMLTPVGARIHVYALIGLRVVLGCFSGQIFVATTEMWQHWAPTFEKVQLVAIGMSGVNLGSFLATYLGFMCTIPYDNGWPFLFYVSGMISVVWWILWITLMYDEPAQNPWISQNEIDFIKRHISHPANTTRKIPWRCLFTSLPLWAYVIVQTCHMWASNVFFLFLPKYMRDVLRFPIKQNAWLSSLPYASRFVGVIFWTFLSDIIRRRTSLGVTGNRKLVQCLGFLSCAVITICIGFANRDYRELSVFLFMAAMFCQSASFASSLITPMDIAPSYASIIVGGFNGVGVVATITAPIGVAYLTPNGTIEEWRSVFYIIAAVYVFGVSVFLMFGSGELQPWGAGIPEDANTDADTPNVSTSDSTIVVDRFQDMQNNQVPERSIQNFDLNSEDGSSKMGNETCCIGTSNTSLNGRISMVDNEGNGSCIPTLAGETGGQLNLPDSATGNTNMGFDSDDSTELNLTDIKRAIGNVECLSIEYTTRL